MKILLEKWTKTRTTILEDYEARNKIKRSEFHFLNTILEIARLILDANVNLTLNSISWLLSYENDIESFKNKLSTEFIDWKSLNLRPLVWKTSAIDSSNRDVQIEIKVESVEIFIIDNTLVLPADNKRRKRQEKINNIFIEKFQYAFERTTYKVGSGHSLIKLNISDAFGLHKFDVSFPLSQEHTLPIPDAILPYSLSKQELEKDKNLIQEFNNKIKDQIKETILSDEKFVYAVCVNVTIHLEKEDDTDDDDSVFFDKMASHIKSYKRFCYLDR